MNPGPRDAPAATWSEASDVMSPAQFHEERPAFRPEADALRLMRRLAAVDMADGIAHDVKNQLTVVVAAVQMVSQRASGADAELLLRARNAAMRAGELMDELVGAACRSAVGGTDVGSALETAVAAGWAYCGARGVRLEMRLAGSLAPAAVPGPAIRLLLLHAIRWVADACPTDALVVAEALAAGHGAAVRLRVEGPEWDGPREWPPEIRALAEDAGVRLGIAGGVPTLYLVSAADTPWEKPGRAPEA